MREFEYDPIRNFNHIRILSTMVLFIIFTTSYKIITRILS